MASSNKTKNVGLNYWSGNDRAKRTDFNNDNKAIDDFFTTIMDDILTTGLIEGGKVKENINNDLSVNVEALLAYGEGVRLYTNSERTVDCSKDVDGNSTAVKTAGNEKWISLYVTKEEGETIFEVYQGTEAAAGSASKPAIEEGSRVLLADILLVYGQTEIVSNDIDFARVTKSTDKFSKLGIIDAYSFEGAKGVDKIQNALDYSETKQGHNIVLVKAVGPDTNNQWNFDKSLEIPSNTTLILQDCYIFLEDSTNDNIMRNKDLTNGNSNINILGIGNPVIDGNAANQDRSSKGVEWIGLRFVKGNNYYIDKVKIKNTAGWGVKFEGINNIEIGTIEFDQDGGQENQDGVHIVGPSKNIFIDKLLGTTQDDMLALEVCSNTDAFPESSTSGGDIENLHVNYVENVYNGIVGHHTLKFIGGSGNKFKNITIGTVSNDVPKRAAVVFLGDYGDSPVQPGDVVNVQIGNIINQNGMAVLFTNATTEQSVWEDIVITNIIDHNSDATIKESEEATIKVSENTTVNDLVVGNIKAVGQDHVLRCFGKMYRVDINNIRAIDTSYNVIVAEPNGSIIDASINDIVCKVINKETEVKILRAANAGTLREVKINHIDGYIDSAISDTAKISIIGNDNIMSVSIKSLSGVFSYIFSNEGSVSDLYGDITCVNDISILRNIYRTVFNKSSIKFDVTGFTFNYEPAAILGAKVIADGVNWDPDGDGNGEYVISDGSTWQEIADMPNLT